MGKAREGRGNGGGGGKRGRRRGTGFIAKLSKNLCVDYNEWIMMSGERGWVGWGGAGGGWGHQKSRILEEAIYKQTQSANKFDELKHEFH